MLGSALVYCTIVERFTSATSFVNIFFYQEPIFMSLLTPYKFDYYYYCSSCCWDDLFKKAL